MPPAKPRNLGPHAGVHPDCLNNYQFGRLDGAIESLTENYKALSAALDKMSGDQQISNKDILQLKMVTAAIASQISDILNDLKDASENTQALVTVLDNQLDQVKALQALIEAHRIERQEREATYDQEVHQLKSRVTGLANWRKKLMGLASIITVVGSAIGWGVGQYMNSLSVQQTKLEIQKLKLENEQLIRDLQQAAGSPSTPTAPKTPNHNNPANTHPNP